MLKLKRLRNGVTSFVYLNPAFLVHLKIEPVKDETKQESEQYTVFAMYAIGGKIEEWSYSDIVDWNMSDLPL